MSDTKFKFDEKTEKLHITQVFDKRRIYEMYKNISGGIKQIEMQIGSMNANIEQTQKQLTAMREQEVDLKPFYEKIKDEVDAEIQKEANNKK